MQVPVYLEEKDFHVILKGNLFQGPWTEGSRLALPKWTKCGNQNCTPVCQGHDFAIKIAEWRICNSRSQKNL
jgi:hypothetical protein